MIDFSESNWFDEYLRYRELHPLTFNSVSEIAEDLNGQVFNRFQSLGNPFYAALQQSGLIYGFPIHYPFQMNIGLLEKLKETERAKLILLDTMMYARLFNRPFFSGEAYTQAIRQTGQLIQDYYNGIHLYKHSETPEMLEKVLFERVRFQKSYLDFRKTGINSQLFWDLYYFLDYSKAVESADFKEENYFPNVIERKKAYKKLALQLIAAAAHANHHLSKQEKSLHHQFERSSKLLVEDEREELRVIFETGATLDEIAMPPLDWIARRFLLDVSLFAIQVDAEVDGLEEAFLLPLVTKLELTSDDLLSSKADLGCFLYQHGEKLHIFKGKKTGILLLGQAMVENFLKLGNAAKMEAVETRDMATTFGKLLINKLKLSKSEELPSEQEIKEAFDQLKDIPKFLPFFGVIFLPVPGITEAYILLAFSIEKLSGGAIRLLPSQISKVVKGEKGKKKTT
ncbi:MAG: hypothetical protein SFU99_02580 [Saprospiraceae bacterium]|nr:hypothetical protein [Saprospiraceae bacterium]